MNNPCSLRRLRPIPQRPLPDLVRARREETAQVQRLAHRRHKFGNGALGANLLALLLDLSVRLETRKALLEANGNGDDGVGAGSGALAGLDPSSDSRKVLILLADVVLFAEVDEINDGFGGKEEKRVDYFDLTDECWLADFLARGSNKV